MFSFYKILGIDIVGISNMKQIFFSIGFGFVHLALAIEERVTTCVKHSECFEKDDVYTVYKETKIKEKEDKPFWFKHCKGHRGVFLPFPLDNV